VLDPRDWIVSASVASRLYLKVQDWWLARMEQALPTGRQTMKDEASYTCDACGQEIVIPIDLSAGSDQEYLEDCPVCCCPNVIHVEMDEHGEVRAWAERE
jgi:hypothetical protein